MSHKIGKFVLLVILSLVFLIFLYQNYFWQYLVKDGQLVKLMLKENYFSNQEKTLIVEVVKNESSVRQGLSSRSQLQTVSGQAIDGMLFIFPETKIRQFWMKDMLFDIDICWIRDKKLLNCARQALQPDPEIAEDNLQIYSSYQEIDMVLETYPAFLSENFLGAKLYLSFF